MRIRTLQTSIWLPVVADDVFAFFADAENLERITPPWMQFKIMTRVPIVMHAGSLIDYKLKWRWLPLTWKTEITLWEPPHRFVDQQIEGPYKQWIHEHTFVSNDGGTTMTDRVDYAVPGGIFEPLIHWSMVGPDVRKIFEYREREIKKLFAGKYQDAS